MSYFFESVCLRCREGIVRAFTCHSVDCSKRSAIYLSSLTKTEQNRIYYPPDDWTDSPLIQERFTVIDSLKKHILHDPFCNLGINPLNPSTSWSFLKLKNPHNLAHSILKSYSNILSCCRDSGWVVEENWIIQQLLPSFIQRTLNESPLPHFEEPNSQAKHIEYVYFLRSESLVKIGKSINPEQRINSLKGMIPGESELLCVFPGSEAQVHKQFKKYRKHPRYEWFEYSEEIRDFVAEKKASTTL